MSTTVKKQVLINARALIADPNHWTRSFFACTEAGQPVSWYASSAAKWCAMGAIYRGAYELVGDRDGSRADWHEGGEKHLSPLALQRVDDDERCAGSRCNPCEISTRLWRPHRPRQPGGSIPDPQHLLIC